MRLEMTSSAFLSGNWQECLKECRTFADSVGFEFGIQLHNTAPAEQIEALGKAGVPLSAHGPLNQKKNWNLATRKTAETFKAIEENIRLFERLKIDKVVFHGAHMCDESPDAFGHGKSYHEAMLPVFRPEFSMFEGYMYNSDFTGHPEFAGRLAILKENLDILRTRYPGFLICLENDFPAYGSAGMFFRDIGSLGHPLCLDTGHLWISTHLMDRDFQREIATALRSGNVRMCHFHASVYNDSIPKNKWSDGHKKLSTPNPKMELECVAKKILKGGVDYFVLEIPEGSAEDLKTLYGWLTK